jgi:hypothetical protein
MLFDKDGNVIQEELDSGYETIDGVLYQLFDGDEFNACWNVGDFHLDDHNRLERVPDSWALEDLRQGEMIYRKVWTVDSIEVKVSK